MSAQSSNSNNLAANHSICYGEHSLARSFLGALEDAKKLEMETFPLMVGVFVMMCFGITGLGDDVI
jgi:hypothetical protein